MEILQRLYDMTAFGELAAEPSTLLMLAIGFLLLYLGIAKRYEPLLLVPIAFGVLLANFPGGQMNVVTLDEDTLHQLSLVGIAKDYGIMNMLFHRIKKELSICQSLLCLDLRFRQRPFNTS